MTKTTEIRELFLETRDFISNASNFSAYIFERFAGINWVGFYMLTGNELLLGPFQGKPACIKIALGRGVCGTSALNRTSIIVDDVHEFPGHIACDSASNSELVIPILINNKLYGVLDIDSPKKSRFGDEDLTTFSELLQTLIACSDMDKIYDYYNQ